MSAVAGARIRVVNYASAAFRQAQKLNCETALAVGGADRVFAHSPRDLDPAFRAANRKTLRVVTGAGLWLWKPYLISRHLNDLGRDEWLFYCDAGSYFVNPLSSLVEHALEHELDVVVFELEAGRLEREWTKRDVLIEFGCDTEEIRESRQRIGGFSLWRRTDAARDLADAWLRAACDHHLISHEPSTRAPEHEGFRAHRGDQSLLSLLTKTRGIPAWRDPSQYGNADLGRDERVRYPQIVELTRYRTPRFDVRLRLTLRRRLAGPLPSSVRRRLRTAVAARARGVQTRAVPAP